MNMGALLIIGKKVNLGNLAGKRVRCTGHRSSHASIIV